MPPTYTPAQYRPLSTDDFWNLSETFPFIYYILFAYNFIGCLIKHSCCRDKFFQIDYLRFCLSIVILEYQFIGGTGLDSNH